MQCWCQEVLIRVKTLNPHAYCPVRAPVTARGCDLSGTVSHVLPACAQCQGRRGRPQGADPASLSPHCHPALASARLNHSSPPPSPGSGVCPCSPAGSLLTLTQLTAHASLLPNLWLGRSSPPPSGRTNPAPAAHGPLPGCRPGLALTCPLHSLRR